MATPQFPDIDALQAILAGGPAAQGELEKLRAQQAQADYLRGSSHAAPMPGTGGIVSPIAAARDAFKHYQGDMMADRVAKATPEVVANAGRAAPATEMFKLRQARALAEQQRGDVNRRHQETRGDLNTYRANTRADAQARDANAGWSQVELENDAGERKLALRKGDSIIDYATKEPVGPGWYARERPYGSTPSGAGGGGADKVRNKQLMSMLATVERGNDIGRAAGNLPQSDINALNSSGEIFKRLLIGAATPQDFTTFLQQRATNLSPSGQQFLVRINALSAEERHRLFGAAVTGKENATSEEFLEAAKGLTLEEILMRAQAAMNKLGPEFSATDRVLGNNGYYEGLFRDTNSFFGEGGEYGNRASSPAQAEAAAASSPAPELNIDDIDDVNELQRILEEERRRGGR